MTTKKEAQRIGKALAEKMGPGWTVKLSQNFDWYVNVVSGIASVSPGDDGIYRAEVRLEEGLSTDAWASISVQFFGKNKDPKKAVEEAMGSAQACLKRTRKTLKTLEAGVNTLIETGLVPSAKD